MNYSKFLKADELGRRQFMLDTAYRCLGVSLAPMLGSSIASNALAQVAHPGSKAEHVIFLNMAGGMSHIDTFDMKPSNKTVQGPVEAIKTSADFQISEYLSKTAKVADKFCVINSMTSKQGAHRQGQYLLHRSYAPRATIQHPALGAWVLRLKGRKNKTIPGFVTIGGDGSPGFFGAQFGGVPIGRPDDGLKNSKMARSVREEDFHKRLAIADTLNKEFHQQYNIPDLTAYDSLYDEATKLMKSDDLKAFDIASEPSHVKKEYGSGKFDKGCLLARRLVESGVRFVEVQLGGWDSHYDNFTSVERSANKLDQGFSVLLKDLDSRGLLEKTLVVIATEFGRTPEIDPNRQDGRQHHPAAFSAILAGGGVKGGIRYGKTDKDGNRVAENPVTIQDLNATIAHALGIDHTQVIHSPSGRPFSMGGAKDELGKPVTEIFA